MTTTSSKNDQPSPTEFQPRYPEGYWDDEGEHLGQGFILQHNEDYLEFLVKNVWKLDRACRLVEFGCGYGRIGFELMRFLAHSSTYTGIDQSSKLISMGRQVWEKSPWSADLHEGSIYDTPFTDKSFDVSLIHTVLMHVPYPDKVLHEMIRVTKPGGLVIACEANRNAHTALLHIEESNHQERAPLELFQTINREIRKRTGVDHNIGVKLPILMHNAGLKQIQIRVSDTARFLYPPVDSDFKIRVFNAICEEGYGQPRPDEEQRKKWKASIMSFGILEQVAETEITREVEEDFLNKGQQYHTVYVSLLTWCFGVV